MFPQKTDKIIKGAKENDLFSVNSPLLVKQEYAIYTYILVVHQENLHCLFPSIKFAFKSTKR